MYTAQIGENSNIGTTYLVMSKMKSWDKLKAEHKTSHNRGLTYNASYWMVLIVRYCLIWEQVSHLCLKHVI